jgi:hypothetical protein
MQDKEVVGKSMDLSCDIGKKDKNSRHGIVIAATRTLVSMTKTERISKLLQGR